MAHICSHSCVWTFDNFLRPLVHRPKTLFGPYVKPGMQVLDVGCGAGFATLGLAKMIGEKGRVVALDVQPEMLAMVDKRAEKAGFGKRVDTQLSPMDTLAINELFDFINAFYMVHEVPDTVRFLEEAGHCLSPGGLFFIAEPLFHVSRHRFYAMCDIAEQVGYQIFDSPKVFLSRAVVLKKSISKDN